MYSQCKYDWVFSFNMSLIASREAQIYFRLPTTKDYEENIWDHTAGALIVREAGFYF